MITILTISIALLALFTAVYFNYKSQEHNRFSVKPFLDIMTIRSEKKKYYKILLRNKGIGPAIIDKLQFKYGNTYYNNFKELLDSLNESIKNKDIIDAYTKLDYYKNLKNSGLSDKESVTLVSIKELQQVNGFHDIIKDVSILVTFHGIYEKEQTKQLKVVD